MIHYITLKIERAELEGQAIPVTEAKPQVPKLPIKEAGKSAAMPMMPKAKPCPRPSPEIESLSAWDLAEMEEEEMVMESGETQNLELRMQSVEHALQMIVAHIEQMAPQPHPLNRAEVAEQ